MVDLLLHESDCADGRIDRSAAVRILKDMKLLRKRCVPGQHKRDELMYMKKL